MNNISYQRTKTAAHMVMEETGDAVQPGDRQPFDRCMVLKNEIRGFLKVQALIVDNRKQYIYDISHLQSVGFLCEQGPLSFETVRSLIDGLTTVQAEAARFLLKEEKIVYNPEYIFMDLFLGTVKCCYDLSQNEDQRGNLQGLIAYLLPKIDSKDKELVSYIYKLYDDSLKKEFSLSDWVEEYYAKKREAETTEEAIPKQEPAFLTETETEVRPAKKYEREKEEWSNTILEEEEIQEESCKEGLFDKLKNKFRLTHRRSSEKEKEEESYFYQPEAEIMPAVQETVFFTPQQEKAEAFLQPMRFGDMPVHLTGKSQIIGKENYADIILTDPTVSRIHARIFYKQDEGYFLEDLNSTNGTLINGKLLQLKQSSHLKDGDLISFGQASYTFCEG